MDAASVLIFFGVVVLVCFLAVIIGLLKRRGD